MQTRDLVQPRIGIIILRKVTNHHLISDTKSIARNFPEVYARGSNPPLTRLPNHILVGDFTLPVW